MASKLTYKELNDKLNKVLSQLQSSDMDIDEAFKAYEEGVKIAKQIEEHLKLAENKVIRLKKQFKNTLK